LLLLTLLENACKHSTQEELNQGQVVIQLETTEVGIMVRISNSKPKTASPNIGQDKVGLNNLRKQLDLRYPNSHWFETTDSNDEYVAQLILETP
ncbi:MAG: hypothetical protein JKX81_04385, partial [Arenicella sp.]|nr:hypothetical protein [Arenicella sp.]